MREIKFRAWDTKIMSYDGFSIEAVGRAYWVGDFMEEMGELGDSCTLMQYTGLKDKNGKEIYEGDILAMPEISKEVYWIVEWTALRGFMHDGEDMPVGFTIKSNIPQHIHPDVINLEIIGNIYENPELLSTP